MTWWEVVDAMKYLGNNPPIHEMLGDWFGCRKRGTADEPKKLGTKEELKALANQWRGAGG